MNVVITECPAEKVTDGEVEEIDSLLTAAEVNLGRIEPPASLLLTHIDTIRRLRKLGVSGEFRITFPMK